MSRFNQNTKSKNITTNKEGSKAYNLDAETELYTLVVTSALSNKFYESNDDRLERLRTLIHKCEPEFVAKLALYARESMYLRSIPLVLTVELNKYLVAVNKPRSIVTKLSQKVIKRADELTEILAYYALSNSGNAKEVGGQTKKLAKLSKALQKGVAQAFNKFDEYQFAKYNRKQEISLKDALFLTHAKPKDKEQAKLFKKLVEDKLEVPYTWEVELSTAKEKGKTKTQVWEELIDSKKLGYMALMRNLRNILQVNVSDEHVIKVAKTLSNEEAVKKSRQLPFRFLSAYKELKKAIGDLSSRYSYYDEEATIENKSQAGIILNALEEAIKTSIINLKGFDYDTKVLIASDVSGSMCSAVSPKSSVQMYDIGLVLSMLLQSKCKYVTTGIFGDTFKTKTMPKDSILQNVIDLQRIEGEVGYSTNGYKVLQYLIEKEQVVDKVMIFTDCQMWNSESGYGYYTNDSRIPQMWNKYKQIAPEAKLYLFDLQGYGNTPLDVKQKDVYLIAGWSEKVFDVLENIDKGQEALDTIKNQKI